MSTTTVPAPAPTAAADELDALRAGLACASLQHGSQRAEIDHLRDQLARLGDILALALLTEAANVQSDEIAAFALRMAGELRATTRPQGGNNG